ncbi:MAG: formimidoylglutamase [Gemmataceae bacterium]|nr:formimidoylglutamase [Gemmataceae bacterium]
MPGASSSAVEWFTRLEPAVRARDAHPRADDPRLGEIIESWNGDAAALQPGRAVLVGFPQDAGVRRNRGRVGSAAAPREIRQWLDVLTPWDGEHNADLSLLPPLDVGDVRIEGSLEETQEVLGTIVGGILDRDAVPVVLGGGHETAFGHYLGYVAAGRRVGIVNIDAHLDVRPLVGDRGHSGSPFRQALEHPGDPLPGPHYVCLGAQPHAVSRPHLLYAQQHGCVVRWCSEVWNRLDEVFAAECTRLARDGCRVYLSIDADAVRAADVPGVSAPNAVGLSGLEVVGFALLAGKTPEVTSFELVEINPRHDRDSLSARWAALVVWNFLVGLALRPGRRLASAQG